MAATDDNLNDLLATLENLIHDIHRYGISVERKSSLGEYCITINRKAAKPTRFSSALQPGGSGLSSSDESGETERES